MIDEPEVVEQDEEELAMQAAHAAIEASRNGTAAPEPVETQAEPVAQQAPVAPAAPAADAEPFEGFSALPEAAQKFYKDALADRTKFEGEAKRLADAEAKARSDLSALHGRVAPLQRDLDRYRKGGSEPQPRAQQRPTLAFDQWLSTQPNEKQKQLRQWPEEAQQQFELARDLTETMLSERLGSIEQQTNERLAQFEVKAELSILAREHSDYQNYGPNNQKFWNWVESQGGEVAEAANSSNATDISAVLTLKKWEEANPIVSETYADPDFHSWLASQSRTLRQMPQSLDIGDRATVINLYAGHLESQVQTDPKAAARVDQIAKRREQQNRVSPSIRPNVAPANAAVNRGGEDAEFAAAEARIQQWRQRQ